MPEIQPSDTSFARLLRVQGIDADAGTFGMTLATSGETSDGHILHIEGGEIPDTLPLVIAHSSSPREIVGSITRFRRHLSEYPARISGVATIELEGDGDAASIRRDLMHMIARGHVRSVSLRGEVEPKDAILRADLPSDHPAHINPMKESHPARRFGKYFKRWRALEGSIVAVGADPLALIGRANETTDPVASFWRAFAESAKTEAVEVEREPEPPSPEALLAAYGAQTRELIARGVAYEALLATLTENKPEVPADPQALLARIDALERQLAAFEGRVSGAPAAPMSPRSLVDSIRDGLAQDRKSVIEQFRAELDARRGKVE